MAAETGDRLVDRIFQQAENDLVVPTEGVYEANGSARFPISDRYVFPAGKGVAHTAYFGEEATRARTLRWLSEGA